ncbi:uncharacterized protein METZ01_LOCUS217661, partial [marine metagenome]
VYWRYILGIGGTKIWSSTDESNGM